MFWSITHEPYIWKCQNGCSFWNLKAISFHMRRNLAIFKEIVSSLCIGKTVTFDPSGKLTYYAKTLHIFDEFLSSLIKFMHAHKLIKKCVQHIKKSGIDLEPCHWKELVKAVKSTQC